MMQGIYFRKHMKTLQLTVLPLWLLILAGCGSMSLEEKRVDYKSGAAKAPSLEIPPDLTAPGVQDQYAIPDGGETSASYSDFAKGGVAQQGTPVSGVLPQSKNVHMERSGTSRWLVVEEKPENVWPQIKAFWQENGFSIKSENMQAGIIETEWAENRAKIPQGGIRSVIGKVLDNLYSSGEKDMYRTRLERIKDGNTTEVYISHYGKEEVLSADQSSSKWQSRPNDPGLEATMLQMLMAKLGGAAEAQAQAGQAQGAFAESTAGMVAAPKLQTLANGSRTILMSEPFDKSWRKLGLALERAGLVVEDKDRGNGVYYLRVAEADKKQGVLDKLAFWRSADSKAMRYRVIVREGSTGVEVAASNDEGASDPEAQRILDALYNQLSK